VIAPELDILLVQDSPNEVELSLRPLRDAAPAARVGVARDGEEALDYLLGRGEYRHRLGAALPRVVLLDLKLPRLDGIEVLRALRASHRTSPVPIVMLVPDTEPRELAQCYQMGASSCVRKPVEFAAFCQVMAAVARYWLTLNEEPPAAGQRIAGGAEGLRGGEAEGQVPAGPRGGRGAGR
jgi:CheY-like chemotaxis protein